MTSSHRLKQATIAAMLFLIAPFLQASAGPDARSSSQRLQIAILGGAFSPFENEVQRIYGTGPQGQLQLGLPLGKFGRITLGAGYFRKAGDPYYRAGDFDAGNAGRFEIFPLSLRIEISGMGGGNTKVFIGTGLDGIWVRENIKGLPKSTGATIGAHLSVHPEFYLAGPFVIVTEGRLQFADVTLRAGRSRYDFDLTGVSLMAGLAYRF